MSADLEKQNAGIAAAELVCDGMVVGLGTGSTAAFAIRALGARVALGLKIIGVPTSRVSEELARGLGIPIGDLDDVGTIDLTIDGADEIDSHFNMIKGAGAALLREKLVALASSEMVAIVDSSKYVACLGQFALPIEVVPFGEKTTARRLEAACRAFGLGDNALVLRHNKSGTPLLTDQGNHIYDARFGRIEDAQGLARALDQVTGVVDHGLFLGIATKLIIGRGAGVETYAKGMLP